MGFATAQAGRLPLGRTPEESRRLLDQTAAAAALSRPLDFSGIEDVSDIVRISVSGELVTISELCAVKRTLRSARELYGQLEELAFRDEGSSERYNCLTNSHSFFFVFFTYLYLFLQMTTVVESRNCVNSF